MYKLKTLVVSVFVAALSLSSIANAVEFRAGLTANATAYYGNVTETLKDSGHKEKTEALAAFNYASGFAEVALESVAGLTIGVEYVPDAIGLDSTTREIQTTLYASKGTPTGEDTQGGIQNIQADVTDVTTVYLALPILNTGISVKAGIMQGSLETKETLATGSTYGDVDIDGYALSAFYDGALGDHMFYRIEAGYVEFDDIATRGSEEGVADSGSYNSIAAELGGVKAAFSIGAKF
jgi:hypothetical protein